MGWKGKRKECQARAARRRQIRSRAAPQRKRHGRLTRPSTTTTPTQRPQIPRPCTAHLPSSRSLCSEGRSQPWARPQACVEGQQRGRPAWARNGQGQASLRQLVLAMRCGQGTHPTHLFVTPPRVPSSTGSHPGYGWTPRPDERGGILLLPRLIIMPSP